MAGKSVKILHQQVCCTSHFNDNSKKTYRLWAIVDTDTKHEVPKPIKVFHFEEELEIYCALHHYELIDACDFYKNFRCFGKSKVLDFIVKNQAFRLVTKKVAREGRSDTGTFWHRVKEEYKAIITPPTTPRQQEETNNAQHREANQTPQ